MAAVTQAGSVRQSGFEVRSTRDRELLLEFLEQDRLTAAYAICDLDDREFPRTRWGIALDGMRPVAVAIEYTGLSPQPLFVLGDPEGVTAVVRRSEERRVGNM